MSSALRRVWLPWLLLLVPTLLIGATALWLLRQEQRRIAQAESDAASRAAAATRERARVAADNIELLVAEVRDGLMRELAETPATDLDALLANWPHTNPLVAQTFLWKPNGDGLAWPPADTPEHVAFRSRHAELFRGGVAQLTARSQSSQPAGPAADTFAVPAEPARTQVAPRAGSIAPAAVTGASAPAQRGAALGGEPPAPARSEPTAAKAEGDAAVFNAQVAQNRMLRQDVQQETKASAEQARSLSYGNARYENRAPAAKKERSSSMRAATSSDSAPSSRPRAFAAEGGPESATAPAKAEAERAPALPVAVAKEKGLAVADSAPSIAEASASRDPIPASSPSAATGEPIVERAAAMDAPARTPERGVAMAADDGELRPALAPWGGPASGWIGRRVGDEHFFLGWWQPAGGGAVRGVELNLPAILERVQALVPAAAADGEHFALLGPGQAPGTDVHFALPLTSTLPGWQLVAWPGDTGRGRALSGEGAFFVVAVLLVLAFVAAILAGGALFFRQVAAAERESALKTSFVSNVSHEMKTPLTTIRMYAEMLAEERVADPEKRRRYFATIGRETGRLTRLVNNALDFGRLEAGRKEYRREQVALAPWLAHWAEVQAPRLAEAGLQLRVASAPAGAAVWCDPDSLEQVVLNLVDNAVKYAAAGGAIDLAVEPRGAALALIVGDRGPGVPAAHRERIFERFHRVDESLTAKVAGAGLGLTIARRLARDQGGDLVCRERAGGGAEFVLTLPAAAA